MKASSLHGIGLALFAICIWGSTFVTTKQLLHTIPPTQILWVRFLIGYGMLWLLNPKPLKWQGFRTECQLALLGLLGITLYFFFENLALLEAPASVVSILVCTAPIFTVLIGKVLRQKVLITRRYWLGVVLAMVGVSCVCTRGEFATLGHLKGIIPSLLGAITWACYTLVKPEIKYPAGPLAPTRRSFFWGLLLMIPLCSIMRTEWVPISTLVTFANGWRLLFLGLFASALCYSAWNLAVVRIGTVQTTLLLYLNPVVGVLTGYFVLHETLNRYSLVGILLTLGGIALSSIPTHRQ